MKLFGKGNVINNLELKPHNILFSWTSPQDYEMVRYMLIEDIDGLDHNEYLLLEGGHCSCYGFDETDWDAIVYTKDELLKLANAEYYYDNSFWIMVRDYFN